MKRELSNNTLLKLSEFIAFNFALHFPEERWDDLERHIVSAGKEFEFKDIGKFIEYITSSPLTRENSEILASYLTVNETYFWREPQTFEALEQEILPGLVRARHEEKRIRIWSAGCSTGEEPYSIAIALRKLIPDIKKWNITIIASDINPKMLNKANEGLYSRWSFRNAPPWLKEKYFVPNKNGKFEIIPGIKNMVTFKYLNLAEDVYPSQLNNTNAMDIIFCRNVLMYFTKHRFKQVVKGLFNSLMEGGYLIVSANELSVHNFFDFMPVSSHGMILYQKTSGKVKKRERDVMTDTMPRPAPAQVIPKQGPVVESITSLPIKPQNVIAEKQIIPHNDTYERNLKLYKEGDYEAVINNLQNSDRTLNKQVLLIKSYANMGKLSEASSICEKAIVGEKLNPMLHYLYATILQEGNKYNEAIASLKRAIYLNPDFILSYFSLGNIYQRLGDFNKSKKYYKNTLSILDKYEQDDILPESEGISAGRFREIINSTMQTRSLI